MIIGFILFDFRVRIALVFFLKVDLCRIIEEVDLLFFFLVRIVFVMRIKNFETRFRRCLSILGLNFGLN